MRRAPVIPSVVSDLSNILTLLRKSSFMQPAVDGSCLFQSEHERIRKMEMIL